MLSHLQGSIPLLRCEVDEVLSSLSVFRTDSQRSWDVLVMEPRTKTYICIFPFQIHWVFINTFYHNSLVLSLLLQIPRVSNSIHNIFFFLSSCDFSIWIGMFMDVLNTFFMCTNVTEIRHNLPQMTISEKHGPDPEPRFHNHLLSTGAMHPQGWLAFFRLAFLSVFILLPCGTI